MPLYNVANRVKPIPAGATLTLTKADAGRTILLDTAAGSVVTLPAWTGEGYTYDFVVTVTATSNSHIVKVGNATDEFRGQILQFLDAGGIPLLRSAADNDDTITWNRTTSGLAAQGHWLRIVDAAAPANHFFVFGVCEASGTEITPFSATV